MSWFKRKNFIGQLFPDFYAITNEGQIKFHDFIGNSWCILFSHPADFTPVCTTELARAAQLAPEFEKRNVKMIALSCNDVLTHLTWIEDIKAYGNIDKNNKFPYPIIEDHTRKIAISLGMIDFSDINSPGLPLTCRAVFIIGPDKVLKLYFMYPATTGRNFDEILRVIDSLQLTYNYKVATPVDWKRGDRCMIDFKLSPEEAIKQFPNGFELVKVPSQKPYLRLTAQPDLINNIDYYNNINFIKNKKTTMSIQEKEQEEKKSSLDLDGKPKEEVPSSISTLSINNKKSIISNNSELDDDGYAYLTPNQIKIKF